MWEKNYLNGNRFQEKSFSVGFEAYDVDLCKCGKLFGKIQYKINGEKVCQDCFDKKEVHFLELNIEGLSEAVRPKDQLWNFVDTLNFEKPIQIHSKRQWESECKKRNLIYRPQRDTTQPKRFESVPIEKKKELIREEMKKLGIYDSKKLFRKG